MSVCHYLSTKSVPLRRRRLWGISDACNTRVCHPTPYREVAKFSNWERKSGNLDLDVNKPMPLADEECSPQGGMRPRLCRSPSPASSCSDSWLGEPTPKRSTVGLTPFLTSRDLPWYELRGQT